MDHEESDIYSFDHGNYTIKLISSNSKEKEGQDIVNESNEEIQQLNEISNKSHEDKVDVEDTKSKIAQKFNVEAT